MSSITINKAIVHVLNKEQREDIKASTMRKTVLDATNPIVLRLVEGILTVYGKRENSAYYGVFSTGHGRKQFCNDFEQYTQLKNVDDKEFMDLSESAMKGLYQAAKITPLASGGYIIFVDYISHQGRYFITAMLKQKAGITISKDLDPQELMELDLNKLAQAARINFSKHTAYLTANESDRQEMNYLTFVSPNSTKDSAGYFISALGCERGAPSAKATKTILEQCKKLFRSRDELKPYASKVKDGLLSFMAERAGSESIKLSDIGHIIRQYIPVGMGDEVDAFVDNFLERLNSEEFGVPYEFSPSQTVINRYTTITGEGENWKMSIDRLAIGDNDAAEFYYQRDTGKLTFTVPDKMRQQIIEELDTRVSAEVRAKE